MSRHFVAFALTASMAVTASCGHAGGADTGIDVPPERCDIDSVCPEEPPLAGGPCAGALRCDYFTCGGPPFADTYECQSGGWVFVASMCIGAPPALAERCRVPDTAFDATARFVITPDAAGAEPYRDGDRVTLVIGPQGGAMIPYRVRIEGVEETPTCVHASARIESDGMTSTSDANLRLRCGSTLRVYEIMPLCPAAGEHEATLEVTVEGLGTQTVRLLATNAMDCALAG